MLVKVAAAGVNRPDVIQRKGLYPPPPGASDIPGLEVAGTAVAAGPGATHLIGSKVCALVTGGGYAEYCVAPAGTCLPVPEVLRMTEAAAMPETLFTVWVNLFERGFAAEGDTRAGPWRDQRDRHDGDQAWGAVRAGGDRHLRVG